MKKLAFVLAGLLSLTTLTGSVMAKSTAPTEKILKMGTNAAFEPFEYVADGEEGLVGEFDGIDVALAKAIAEDNGYTLEIVDMPFDSLGVALETGKVDFVAAAMTVTEERMLTFDFSTKYYNATQYIIIREADVKKIKSTADLKGKKVGVQIATTGDIICSEMDGVTVQSYNRGADAILALVNKQVSAVVIDSEPAKNFIKNTKGLTFVEDPEAFENEEYGMAVKKGNEELLEQINKTLDKMIEDGSINEIFDNYIE